MNRRFWTYALILAAGIILGATILSPGFTPPVTVAEAAEVSTDPFLQALGVQEAFRSVSAKITGSVVEITVQSENLVEDADTEGLPWDDFFADPSSENQGPRFFRSRGLGSGVIVENSGNVYYIVTNSHVVAGGEGIVVELYDRDKVDGVLVGRDERKDLALVRIEYSRDHLPVALLGDSDSLYVGDWVLAFGSPYGYEHSVSSGIVSALGRRDGPGENINDFIQTDASINQGNSGGPLVNIRGEVVGINTFITTPNSGSIGLGFAIPINNVRSTVRQLIDYGEVRYGWLGVSLGAYGPEAAEELGHGVGEGVLVYQVFDGSPGDEAGLRAGDLVLSLDGSRIGDHERLIYRIGDKAPGDRADFTVDRFGDRLSFEAVMGEREGEDAVRAMHSLARPGFVPAPLTSDLRSMMELPDDITGVPVAEVYPRTQAQAVDLRAGDIILKVNDTVITGMQGLYIALGGGKTEVPSFTVYRDGERIVLQEDPGSR